MPQLSILKAWVELAGGWGSWILGYGPGILQTLAIGVGVWKVRKLYPFFLASLTGWLPVLWNPSFLFAHLHPGLGDPHHLRELWIVFPCSLVLAVFQPLASLEAFFKFGRRYPLASTISAVLGSLCVPGILVFWAWPSGDPVSQAVLVSRYSRVGCWIFLTVSTTLYGLIQPRDLLSRSEGRHLLILTGLSWTWALPIIWWIGPQTWAGRSQPDLFICWFRAILLLGWVILVPLHDSHDSKSRASVQDSSPSPLAHQFSSRSSREY